MSLCGGGGGGEGGKVFNRSAAMEIEAGPMPGFAVRGSPIAPQKEERRARMAAEARAACKKKAMIWAAELKESWERMLAGEESEDDELDPYAVQAAQFRDTWNRMYSRYHGRFEDTTKIPNKRFTYKKPGPQDNAGTPTTLQIFSLKVARIKGGLQWPLHVFGMVAIRDTVDRNRNMVFHRPRHNCQILTQEVPYLKLIGPTRAVLVLDPLTFEVDLKVKGATESEDKCLSFLAVSYIHYSRLDSHLLKRDYKSKLSTLEFELGSIKYSVEATVSLRVKSGSWPDGFRVQFAASTASIGDAEIILLDSEDDEVPVAGYYGNIKLSRCVVSVEVYGRLSLFVKAWHGDDIYKWRSKSFKAKTAGTSAGIIDCVFCTMDVSIAWSLISSY